jgi:alginate O-acetyltransferase complex protein AlgJ
VITGRLESVVDGGVVGWAWDSNKPDKALDIEVQIDGEPVAEGSADLQRPDLAEGRKAGVPRGFRIELPVEIASATSHTVRVTAGTRRRRIAAWRKFRTIVKSPDSPWQGTEFTPLDVGAASATDEPITFEDDAPDPGGSALVGRRLWLFHCPGDDSTVERLRGTKVPSDEGLEAERQALLAREDGLTRLGVPYLFAVAPIKERVYPRRLPKGASLHPTTPAARLNELIRDARGTEAFDLLPPLIAARDHGELYQRTDVNWNQRGAFFAYRALFKEAAKRVTGLEPIEVEEAGFVAVPGFSGDLADKPKVVLAGDELIPFAREISWEEEGIQEADAAKLRSQRMPAPGHLEVPGEPLPRVYEIAGDDAQQLPRAVLLGDSCCLNLIPWLAEHFQRLVFLWGPEPPLEAIELEMPDILLQVVSERGLGRETGTPHDDSPAG